ncbi:MAG: RNA-binding protein [Maribacter sp.]|nr:MAG: RNA-binding protein [Maribacter sp.]
MAKRKNSGIHLSDALQDFIKENKLQKGMDKVNAREAWANLMGNGVNNYTTSIELRNEILYVSLSSSVLREELSHGKSKIITMLNEELGKDLVKKLILR